MTPENLVFSEQTTTTIIVVNRTSMRILTHPLIELIDSTLLLCFEELVVVKNGCFHKMLSQMQWLLWTAAADVVVDDLDGHEYLGQLFLSLNACDGVVSHFLIKSFRHNIYYHLVLLHYYQ